MQDFILRYLIAFTYLALAARAQEGILQYIDPLIGTANGGKWS